ncbi:sigma-54 dependent transcriptional regulator [Acidobacteriia bacterium AH_259_A11_L15]|nr:sigma-54 dependent transcriptional regulator [Acidobacteriia bacterium AH_259_A11_L15]
MPPAKAKPNIAIVDDDGALRLQLAAALKTQYNLFEGDSYQGAYRLLQEFELDVVLLDLKLLDGTVREGLMLLRDLDQSDIDTLAIVLSDDPKKTTALRVMDAGAYDYFVKPVDPDVLRTIIERAVEKLRIERENRILREELKRKDALGDLLGSTEAMRGLFESIRRVARSSSTVVIRGESGTGKELVARAIHDLSQRRDRAFVSVNCAALPETLMEAELFGYEKGAFTGATATKEGRVELAHRGTLFLDEIGILTPALQSKLLRVLEEHTLVRLGGTRAVKVDFRLLTATNEDLEELVRQRRFREDLYYRIHVVPLLVPPLRERVDDIPLLVEYFVKVYCAVNHLLPKRIDDEVLEALKRYPWPGNVRELENAVQRMVLMSDGELITGKYLPRDLAQTVGRGARGGFRLPPSGFHLEEEVAAFERRYLEAALAEANGVKAQAAQRLGVNRDKMKYLCRKYGL